MDAGYQKRKSLIIHRPASKCHYIGNDTRAVKAKLNIRLVFKAPNAVSLVLLEQLVSVFLQQLLIHNVHNEYEH